LETIVLLRSLQTCISAVAYQGSKSLDTLQYILLAERSSTLFKERSVSKMSSVAWSSSHGKVCFALTSFIRQFVDNAGEIELQGKDAFDKFIFAP